MKRARSLSASAGAKQPYPKSEKRPRACSETSTVGSIADNSESESTASMECPSPCQQYGGNQTSFQEIDTEDQQPGLLARYPVLSLPLKKRPPRDGSLSWAQFLHFEEFYARMRGKIALCRQQRERTTTRCIICKSADEQTSTTRGIKPCDLFK